MFHRLLWAFPKVLTAPMAVWAIPDIAHSTHDGGGCWYMTLVPSVAMLPVWAGVSYGYLRHGLRYSFSWHFSTFLLSQANCLCDREQ